MHEHAALCRHVVSAVFTHLALRRTVLGQAFILLNFMLVGGSRFGSMIEMVRARLYKVEIKIMYRW